MYPTVGRTVHYFLNQSPQPIASIITGVNPDGTVNLHVFPDGEPSITRAGIVYSHHPEHGKWGWPWRPREEEVDADVDGAEPSDILAAADVAHEKENAEPVPAVPETTASSIHPEESQEA